jgi:AbrB family looped-hinge helix DNA binding protein
MGKIAKLTTVLSTKGQVILPKAIRSSRNWVEGTRLTVEDTPDGVLLRPAPLFARTRPSDVYGMLQAKGRARSLEEMDAAILAEAKRNVGN